MLTQQILGKLSPCQSLLVGEFGCQRWFDSAPGESLRQHRQGVSHIDHGIQAGAEKIGCAHDQDPPESNSLHNVSRKIWCTAFTKTSEDSCGFLGFCRVDYRITRQSGSHARLTCEYPVQHHVTVPLHDPLRVGTLAGVLAAVADAHSLSREELLQKLLG